MPKKMKSAGARNNAELFMLTLPALVLIFVFSYLPMGGLILAFKQFRYDRSIFQLDWVGLKNFEFFFKSQDAASITFNTVAYATVFLLLEVITAATAALMLYEIRNRTALKVYQTVMLIPHFLSWVIVSFMVYLVFNPRYGVAAGILKAQGLPPINWYGEAGYWPFILTYANIWKKIGLQTILYYSALMGIDPGLFEAAIIDGAKKRHLTRFISIPALYPVITILLLLGVADLFRGDFGLFYQLPKNSGMLFETTNVIDTHVYRSLIKQGNVGMSAAIGLFQSLVGMILVLLSNAFVRWAKSDNSVF